MLAVLVGAAVFFGFRRAPAIGFGVTLLVLVGVVSNLSAISEPARVARWAALAALLLAGGRLALRAGRTPAPAIVAGVATLLAASVVWSIDPSLTIMRGVSFVGLLAIVFLVLAPAARNVGARESFARAVAVVVSFVVGSSLFLFLIDRDRAVYTGELTGVLENPNALGLLVGLAYPFMVFATRAQGLTIAPLLAAGSGALMAASAARSGLLALIVAIGVLDGVQRRWRTLGLHFGIALSAFVLIGFLVNTSAGDVPVPAAAPTVPGSTSEEPEPGTGTGTGTGSGPKTGTGSETGTETGPTPTIPTGPRADVFGRNRASGQSVLGSLTGARDEGWAAAARIVEKRPVHGFGFGVGDRLFERYPKEATFRYFQGANPGNAYLHLGMELGIVGAALFLLPLLLAAVLGIASLRDRAPPQRVVFVAVLLAGLAAATFETILSAAGAPWALIIWLAAAVVIADEADRIPWPRRLRPHGLDEEASGPLL